MSDVSFTPTFVFKYESRMRASQENEFARALLGENLWWPRLSKGMTIDGASERLTWILNTAKIYPVGDGGNVPFDTLVTQTTELVPQRYAAGIKTHRDRLLDLRGGGLDLLAEWSTQVGAAIAYFPQRLQSELVLNGANTDGSANAYDGVPFFADNLTSNVFGGQSVVGHPYNPFNAYVGGYANWLHGAATSFTQPNGAVVSYPGALPIDYSVTIDVAFQNIAKAISYARSWKMPDGITPRFLTPAAIVVAPYNVTRAQELTSAKFIAQAANSGGGSGDVMATIRRWGIGEPIEAQEFAASTSYTTQINQAMQTATGQATGQTTLYKETITGNDTSWYLVMKENVSSQLGGMIHVTREPFRTNYFSGEGGDSGMTGLDAVLNRALEIEYITQGRMAFQYGHPYAWLRIDAV